MNIQPLGNVAPTGLVAQHPGPPTQIAVSAEAQTASAANVTQQAVPPPSKVKPSPAELEDAVKRVNEFVGSVNNSLNFTIDKETGATVVKVIDNATKEVIKQFPSEEMLAIAKALDNLKGLLVQQKA